MGVFYLIMGSVILALVVIQLIIMAVTPENPYRGLVPLRGEIWVARIFVTVVFLLLVAIIVAIGDWLILGVK